MKKLFLISHPRCGTSYFIKYLNSNEFTMTHEVFNKTSFDEVASEIDKLIFQLLKYKAIVPDNLKEELLITRCQDAKNFFYRFSKYLKFLGLIKGSKYYGFKIFSYFVDITNSKKKCNLSINEVIDYSDSIIVLDRNIKEIAFSYCQAIRTNKWAMDDRTTKINDLILTEKETDIVIKLIKNAKVFFEDVSKLIKEKNKNALYIHYDDFATDGWEKVANFLDVKLVKEIPFSKLNYDYDDFFKKHPSIEQTINNLYTNK